MAQLAKTHRPRWKARLKINKLVKSNRLETNENMATQIREMSRTFVWCGGGGGGGGGGGLFLTYTDSQSWRSESQSIAFH